LGIIQAFREIDLDAIRTPFGCFYVAVGFNAGLQVT